jgi:hypothetical protein
LEGQLCIIRRRRCRLSSRVYPIYTMTSNTSTPTIVFPTPVLTPIVGRPTFATLQVLQQQLYQNARSVVSHLGGGLIGHLAIVMPPADYAARPNAVAFIVPLNPGPRLMPPANATTVAFNTYHAVRIALTNQIIAAVERTYLHVLNDADFGFADVMPYTMLAHLKTTYSTMTWLEIEQNRAKLAADWDTSSP